MIMKILGVVRLSVGFGGIWVANGDYFGRLAGYFRFVRRFRHAVALSICRFLRPARLIDQTTGTGTLRAFRIPLLNGRIRPYLSFPS